MSGRPARRRTITDMSAPSDYQPMSTPRPFVERLSEFITDELSPELERIRRKVAAPSHKADLFEIGHLAIALRMRISTWLAQTERELDRQTATQYEAMWESSRAQAAEANARAMPADLLKAKVREACGALIEAKGLLNYYRSDLDSLQSYVQTGVRSMRDEEMGMLDAPAPNSGVWKT